VRQSVADVVELKDTEDVRQSDDVDDCVAEVVDERHSDDVDDSVEETVDERHSDDVVERVEETVDERHSDAVVDAVGEVETVKLGDGDAVIVRVSVAHEDGDVVPDAV